MNNQIRHWDQGNKRFFKIIIFLVEIVLLNVYTLIYFNAFGNPFGEENVRGIWLAINASYAVTVLFITPFFLYRRMTAMSMVGNVMKMFFFITVISLLLIAFLDVGIIAHYKRIPVFYLLLLVLLLTERMAWRYIMRWYRRLNHSNRNIVFFGESEATADLLDTISRDDSFGYHIVGYFADAPSTGVLKDRKYLGTFDSMDSFFETFDDHVAEGFCCLSSDRSDDIKRTADVCDKYVVEFRLVPNFWSYMKRPMQLHIYGNTPLLFNRTLPLSNLYNRLVKRAFDVVFSLLFLVLVFPWVFLVVAAIMKLTMPGPIFFRQKRNGMNGDTFWCYKFRSMKVNADADRVQATKDDPRKTPFGNFMRKTSIDELPQFWNVLRGDMSVVGPRPHMVQHTEQYSQLISKYMVRHFAKPGITGWAQVNGCRGETKELWQMEERVKKDIWYIEHWTFLLDLHIIWLTIGNSLIKKDKLAY